MGQFSRGTAPLLVAVCLLAGPALAQDRSPAHRQVLTDLARTLGESHGLRQVCEGPSDQTWRTWMSRLLEAEAPDDAFDRRLREAFNTGYYAAQARFPECDSAARAEAARSAARGKALSRQARAR